MNVLKRQKGLSLLELLVVFVIISLVSTVLVQGFGFGLSLYERVQSRGDRVSSELLLGHWFRSCQAALVAGKTLDTAFSGDSKSFEGVTLNPLLGEPGFPVHFQWRLEVNTLIYQEADAVLVVQDTLEGAGAFEYLDGKRGWLAQWEPLEGSLEMPRAVRYSIGSSFQITAAVRSRLSPDLLLEESRRER